MKSANPVNSDPLTGSAFEMAAAWKSRRKEKDVGRAIQILTEKFASVDDFGPAAVVEFHGSPDSATQAMQARRAFETVQQFLSFI